MRPRFVESDLREARNTLRDDFGRPTSVIGVDPNLAFKSELRAREDLRSPKSAELRQQMQRAEVSARAQTSKARN